VKADPEMTALKQATRKSAASTKNSRLKVKRLSMRIDAFAKARLERAAAYTQKSVSEYVVARALEAAEADITTHEKVILPKMIWDSFFNALQKPPKQNAEMKALLKAHDQAVASR
jgi:uncharacterized protein (DUF1778 family)